MQRARRSSRLSTLGNASKPIVENLETRRLFSTIVWDNKGSGAGVLDTDDFNAVFGATNGPIARQCVQRAIDDWERVITNFNYAGGGNTFTVDISATVFSGGLRGRTNNITVNNAVERKPITANIEIDDNGGDEGWYFDPVVGTSTLPDDGEFTTVLTPFDADRAGLSGFDIYRTSAHELGHAMGLLNSNGGLRIGDFLTNTGITDPLDSDETLRTINVNGGPVDYTLTTSGGGHLFEGAASYNGPEHPNALMNAGRNVPEGTRRLIGDTEAELLRDVYGYTVVLPSTINTFYANLNTSNNVLTVTGDINENGSDTDLLDINDNGANTQFLIGGTSELIPDAQYQFLNVNMGLGNDDVDVNFLPSGKNVTVNMGDGNDRVDVSPLEDDIDTNVLSNFLVAGGVGTDTITFHDTADGVNSDTWTMTSSSVTKATRAMSYNTVELLDVNGNQGFATTYNVDGTALGAVLDIFAGNANDILNIGNGDYDTNLGATVTFAGGTGTNTINVDDQLDGSTADVYDFNTASFSKPGQVLNHSGVTTISVLGSDQDSTWRINSSGANLSLTGGDGNEVFRYGDAVGSVGVADITQTVQMQGGAGNDQFLIGNGDLDEGSGPITIIDSSGTDTLLVNDTDDTGADTYQLVNGLFQKPGAGSFDQLSYSSMNDVTFDMNGLDNTFNFTDGFNAPQLQGNGGADTFNIINTAPGSVPTVRGGAGLDNVSVNELVPVGTATMAFDQDEDLANFEMFEGSTVNLIGTGETGVHTQSSGFLRGVLNLNRNFFVSGSAVSFLLDRITRGYNGGAWNGAPAGGASGVIRSAVAADASPDNALGYATVGAANGQLNIASYRGTVVNIGDTVVSYTLYGDNNLDRTVNINDFSFLANNFNIANTNWVRGNYNYDNITNISDFSLLASNFNQAAARTGFGSTPSNDRDARSLTEVINSTVFSNKKIGKQMLDAMQTVA